MRTIAKTFFIVFFLVIYVSCNNDKIIEEFSDDFNSHETFWKRNQITDPSRALIIEDPTDKENSCLKFSLFPDDKNAGSRRNEYVLKTEDTIGYTVDYSFKFMFPKSFFKKREKKDWIMLHQWHDDPPSGVSWKDYKEKTKPPVSIYIQVNPDGNNIISYTYGLNSLSIKERQNVKYTKPIEPEIWYTFTNTIKWSLESNEGFSIPKINNEFLVPNDIHPEHKLLGNNMYNEMPNYYKMGLYGNFNCNDTISVYIDDFKYTLRKNTE